MEEKEMERGERERERERESKLGGGGVSCRTLSSTLRGLGKTL